VFYNRGVCYVAKLAASTSWDIVSKSCFDFTNQKQGHLAHPNNDEVLNWLAGIAAINTLVSDNLIPIKPINIFCSIIKIHENILQNAFMGVRRNSTTNALTLAEHQNTFGFADEKRIV
jgi:hypothetical protein